MPPGIGYTTEEEIIQALENDPVFQRATPKAKVRMAQEALRAAGFGAGMVQEQPEVLEPRVPTREFSYVDPYDLGASTVEVAAAGIGAHLGRKAVLKAGAQALKMAPHPAAKALGYGLEFAGGLSGAASGGGAAAAGRTQVSKTLGREDVSPEEALERGAKEGIVGELGGRVLETGNKLLGKAVTGGKMSPAAARDLAEAERHGIQLRPAEVSESAVAAQNEMSVRRSLAGAGKFQALDEKNQAALRAWAEGIARQYFGGLRDPMMVGQEVQAIIRGESIPAFRARQRELYEVLDQIKGIQKVESKRLLNELLTLRATIDDKIAPKAGAVVDLVIDKISTINPKTGARVPKGVSFADLHDLRSLLLQIGRDNTDVLSNRTGGIAGHIANKTIFEAMESAARRSGPRAFQEWRRADKYTRLGSQLFDDAAIRGALDARPEDMVKIAFKRDQITETQKIMAALKRSNDPQRAIRLYRQGAMAKLLADASVDGFLDAQRLYNAVYGKTGIGRAVMEETFGKRFMAEFDKLLSVARRMNLSGRTGIAGNPSQTSRGIVNWAEQGMILQVPAAIAYGSYTGKLGPVIKDIAATGSYFLGMDQLARIMNSPRGIEMLRRGMLVSPRSQEAIKLVPRIMAVALGEIMAEPPTENDILDSSRLNDLSGTR